MRQLCMLLILVVCTSCSGGQSPSLSLGGEEGTKVALAVEELNEAKGDEKKLSAFFVSKEARPKARELNKYNFYIAGTPSLDGMSAKCKVLIEKQDGSKVAEPTWDFEKVGDNWKIKSAPLQ